MGADSSGRYRTINRTVNRRKQGTLFGELRMADEMRRFEKNASKPLEIGKVLELMK